MMETTVSNSPHSLRIFLTNLSERGDMTGVAGPVPLINQPRSGIDYDLCSQVLSGCGPIVVDQCPARINGDTTKDA